MALWPSSSATTHPCPPANTFHRLEIPVLIVLFIGIVALSVALSGLNGAENVLIVLYMDSECILLPAIFMRNFLLRNSHYDDNFFALQLTN
jgi:hypothetical protein